MYSLLIGSVFLIPLALCQSDWVEYDPEVCWQNEEYVVCGGCEATCHEPVIRCKQRCKPARCECPAFKGYVRSKHGHCIHVSECPGPNIFSMDPDRVEVKPSQAKMSSEPKKAKRFYPLHRAKNEAGPPPDKRYFPVGRGISKTGNRYYRY